MMRTDADRYLGDVLSSSDNNSKNIKARCNRGIGINSNISIILNELCLGKYHFKVALLLRESLLLSSVLLNCETWVNVTKNDLFQLQKVDRAMVRSALRAPSKSPGPSIFLEVGAVPIKYYLIGRRIVFLHYILMRPENDLLSQVFFAQLEKPVKNDWSEQIKEDLKLTELDHLTFDNIKAIKRDKFKIMVKEKIRKLAFKDLLQEKEKLSKMKNLQYDELKLQKYLASGKLNTTQKRLL